jgi:hypothetical protein
MRRFWTFVLLGPPLGGTLTILAELHTSSVGKAISVVPVILPLSYLVGGIPAIVTAIITSAIAKYLTTFARLMVSVYVGGVLTMIFTAMTGGAGFDWKLPIIGALSALGCSSLIEYLDARKVTTRPA